MPPVICPRSTSGPRPHCHAGLPVQRAAIARQARQFSLVPRAAASAAPSTVQIRLQGLHMDLTPSLKSYAEQKVGKAVSHFEVAVKQVDIRLSVSGGDRSHGKRQQRTEVTVHTLRNGIVRVEDVEESMYASIDLVCDKLARKLRKVKEKAMQRGKWPGRGGPRGGLGTTEFASQEGGTADLLEQEEPAAEPGQAAAQNGTRAGSSDAARMAMPSEILRTKYFFLKPMSVEAALEQCENLGHDFFVFREQSSDQMQVIYKRKHQGYGLLVPEYEEHAPP